MVTRQTAAIPSQTEKQLYRIALVGNPNTGKTTLFNSLTGLNQKVGNYPGVTVERKVGKLQKGEKVFEFIDLPGTYSMAANSLDEMIVTDVLLNQQPGENPVDMIVAVVDAGNINRNLYLVSQLVELNRPIIIVLNMCDLAEGKSIHIDTKGLSQRLGVPIVPMCASKGSGFDLFINTLEETVEQGGHLPKEKPVFPGSFEHALKHLQSWINQSPIQIGRKIEKPELFRALVDENRYAEERLRSFFGADFVNQLHTARKSINSSHPLSSIETMTRYQWINNVLGGLVRKPKQPVQTKSDQVDKIITHKVYGMVIFIAIMTLVFQSIYSWAGPLMDVIEGFFAACGSLVTSTLPPGALQSLIVNGMIGGVGSVLVFLPQIAILFLFLGILDDCGYMPRAAFMMDRLLSKCGLSGKSFIPLLSSFACAVPGIMATRTIESKRERFITILIAPLMSCSARLPVYLVLIGAFIPSQAILGTWLNLQAITLLGFYMLGIIVAIPIALILKRFIHKGQSTPFVLEFPSFKCPTPRTVLLYVYEKTREFVGRAGTIIFCFSVIIWALSYFPRPESIHENYEAQRAQMAQNLQAEVQPQLSSLNKTQLTEISDPQEFSSALLNHPRLNPNDDVNPSTRAEDQIASALAKYQDKLRVLDNKENGDYVRASFLGQAGKIIEPIVEPLGWDWRIGMAALASFPARELVVASLGTILNVGADIDEESKSLNQALTNTKRANGEPLFNLAVALSLMVFFALCAQCVSTLAIIQRETNSITYPLITFGYMTTLAYFGAMITYQLSWLASWA